MSKLKMKNNQREVKAFWLNKSIVVTLPKDFLTKPVKVKQTLEDKKLILEVKTDG